ncbi:BrnA antitoxin family protein, partial [Burkholderia pseudomallei]
HTDWVDPDDAPELTDEFFERADEYVGDRLVRRGPGRPLGSHKTATTIRLDD